MTEPEHTPQAGIADAFAQLSQETATLVRQEIQAAKTEMVDRLTKLAPGAGMLAAGGAAGLFAVASAYRLSLRLLEARMSPTKAALLATTLYGAAATALITTALRQIKEAPAPFPAETVEATRQAVADVRSSGG
jgi:Putative Actinobacterial Holin-X, holin superfamily III